MKRPWQSKTLLCNLILGTLPFVWPHLYEKLARLSPEVQVQILSVALCGVNCILRHLTHEKITWVLEP